MRLGVTLPYFDRGGEPLRAAAVAERARMIEAAGFEGVWSGDHLPRPGFSGSERPDALANLTLAALATDHVELGTCIYIVPVRNPFDLAQRFYTLETFAPGRMTFGLGTGSQQKDYEAVGLDWGDRFKLLAQRVDEIREMFSAASSHQIPPGNPGYTGTPVSQPTWDERVGTPRFVLGAWHSESSLRRAVGHYDGWMASAGPGSRPAQGGWRKVLTDAIHRYRDLGGTRAMVSTVNVDLTTPTVPLSDDDTFSLRCGAEEARDRLGILDELGFDDVILWPSDRTSAVAFSPQRHDFTPETLEEIRALLPESAPFPTATRKA